MQEIWISIKYCTIIIIVSNYSSQKAPNALRTRHTASTRVQACTRWHFAFAAFGCTLSCAYRLPTCAALCCHSNETHAPIANLPNSAQLGSIPYHAPKLYPGPCSSVGIRPWIDTQTPVTTILLHRLWLMRNVTVSTAQLKYTKTTDNVFDMIELLTWLAVISRCFNLVQLRAVHSDWYTSAQYWQWTWRLWHCLTWHSADKSRKKEVYWVTFTRRRQRLSAMTLLVGIWLAKDSLPGHLSNLGKKVDYIILIRKTDVSFTDATHMRTHS